MTTPKAVRLVMQSAAIGRPGEMMILDMGEPVWILDLAQQLVDTLKPGHPIVFTGLRPGKKLNEVLVGASEAVTTREHPRIFHACGASLAEALGVSESPILQQLQLQLRLDQIACEHPEDLRVEHRVGSPTRTNNGRGGSA